MVDKRGSFGAQNTSLTLKIRKKGFSRLYRADFFLKIQKKILSSFLGHVFATLKPVASLMRSCGFHRLPN